MMILGSMNILIFLRNLELGLEIWSYKHLAKLRRRTSLSTFRAKGLGQSSTSRQIRNAFKSPTL